MADGFWAQVEALRAAAGSVAIATGRGARGVRLGSFGLLCFVFERTPDTATVEHIRRLKRFRFRAEEWMVA